MEVVTWLGLGTCHLQPTLRVDRGWTLSEPGNLTPRYLEAAGLTYRCALQCCVCSHTWKLPGPQLQGHPKCDLGRPTLHESNWATILLPEPLPYSRAPGEGACSRSAVILWPDVSLLPQAYRCTTVCGHSRASEETVVGENTMHMAGATTAFCGLDVGQGGRGQAPRHQGGC